MKKLVTVALMVVGLSSMAFAQEKGEGKEGKEEKENKVMVPTAVKQAFEKQHAGVKAKWDNEDGKFEASFKKDKQDMSVLYNANGTMEEMEASIPVTEVPANIKAYITAHKLGKIKEAAKITKANGTVEYEAEVKTGDALFDSKGNFIKIVKD